MLSILVSSLVRPCRVPQQPRKVFSLRLTVTISGHVNPMGMTTFRRLEHLAVLSWPRRERSMGIDKTERFRVLSQKGRLTQFPNS
jgi:hypothetical protein